MVLLEDILREQFVRLACPCCGKIVLLEKVKKGRYKKCCSRCGSKLYYVKQANNHFDLAVTIKEDN